MNKPTTSPISTRRQGDVLIILADNPPVNALGAAVRQGLVDAIGCHYRVAVPSAKLGNPEVKLGLLPGAGGTQRLPRVAGVRQALEMCATGNPIGASQAVDCGLVDRLAERELLAEAVAFAEEVSDARPLPRSSERQDKLGECSGEVFDTFRKEHARRFRGFEAP